MRTTVEVTVKDLSPAYTICGISLAAAGAKNAFTNRSNCIHINQANGMHVLISIMLVAICENNINTSYAPI